MGKRRFMAEVWGYGTSGIASTPASRLGSSGVVSHTRGWNSGIKVVTRIDDLDDSDVFEVWTTGGSHDADEKVYLGKLTNTGWYPSTHEDA